MIYHVFANRSNIGDWLSAKGIQKLLSPLEITECLCDGPYVEETMSRLSKATEKDLIVIGGGGLLMDYFEPFWSDFKRVVDRVPFCIWGIGCCDIKHEPSLLSKALIEDILCKSKFCIVRDELTRGYLSSCDLPPSIPCPSIYVIRPPKEKPIGILHMNNYTTAGANTYEIMCSIAKAYAERTGRVYRETNNRIRKDGELALSDRLRRYALSDIVLSSGLHGCIIGAAMGLKVLAVSGDRKIEGFMEAIGLSKWVLDTSETDSLQGKLEGIHLQKDCQAILSEIREKHLVISDKVIRLYNSE